LRVYAEDPLNNFLPSVGLLETYKLPSGEGVRVDGGYEEGMEVPIYYDPMLAKLVVHGATRAEAIQKLKTAIAAYQVEGVATTLPFGAFVLDHPAFVSGDFDTHFVQQYYTPEKLIARNAESAAVAALLSLRLHQEHKRKLKAAPLVESNWGKRG
jgi:acetyl/propionyl-CoA carboxylase alpha subunit